MGKGGRSKNRSRGGRKTFKKMDVIILRKEKKIRKDWVKGLKKIPCEYIRRNAHLKVGCFFLFLVFWWVFWREIRVFNLFNLLFFFFFFFFYFRSGDLWPHIPRK